jgi:putative Mg2+ transporter-C (MgtC) family protein
MLEFLDFLRTGEIGWLTVTVRLVLAVFCGGFIGLERERKRRPAGFRTHILICLGAAMTTLTSQFLVLNLGANTDMARLGAQVIAGVGFIGAGTIIVTKRRQVKGLTTAAGLWTSAIVGLCCGAGFFEGAVLATLIILIVEFGFVKLEYSLFNSSRSFNIYVEYSEAQNLGVIVDVIKNNGAYIKDIEITKSNADGAQACAIFSLKMPKKQPHRVLMTNVMNVEGVVTVEEL